MQNSFEELKKGLLFRCLKKESEEPAKAAVGRVSTELRFLQRQSEYATEVARVLEELNLTVSLIVELKDKTDKELPASTNRQKLLLYYQGYFFNLIHQMKDKILQLVNLMTEETVPEKPDRERDVSLRNLFDKKGKRLSALRIRRPLELWNQEDSDSPIAVVLRRRTTHHHKISQLRYNEDVQNLQLVETMENPQFRSLLTQYGIGLFAKKKAESAKKLFCDIHSKTKKTLEIIQNNLNEIAEPLITHFKLPVSTIEIGEILQTYTEMSKTFSIKNKASFEKIPELHQEKIKTMVTAFGNLSRNRIEAVYLVGSLGRGEYEEGYSDVNIYIITTSESGDLQKSIQEIITYDQELSLLIFNKKEFLSDNCRKYRFIAYSDGILLYGNDLLQGEKFPKPGLYLALLLNEDFVEKLEAIEEWIRNNPEAPPTEISKKSKAFAKDAVSFIFGVTISNKPQYTSSRRERVLRINEMYPGNRERGTLDTLLGVMKYGVGTLESLRNLVSGFRPQALRNLEKMKRTRSGLDGRAGNK